MAGQQAPQKVKHRWRFYETASGRKPVREYLATLPVDDFAEVVAAMKDAEDFGLLEARHLRGEIYELRVNGRANDYRLLFATEGNHDEILLALESFPKKTQKTPPQKIDVAMCSAHRRPVLTKRRTSHPLQPSSHSSHFA